MIKNYVNTLRSLIFHPITLFKDLPAEGKVLPSLAFAMVTQFLGIGMVYLWISVFKISEFSWFQDLVSFLDQQFTASYAKIYQEFFLGFSMGSDTGELIFSPFKTLLGVFIAAFFIFIGAWLLTPRKQDRQTKSMLFKSAITIICLSYGPTILMGIPILGILFSVFYQMILIILGIAKVYRVTYLRALAIYLLPLLLLTILIALFFLALAASK